MWSHLRHQAGRPWRLASALALLVLLSVTASEKFKGVMASHDLTPRPGDAICPITLTKANPKFTWVVGGKTYAFCCPPCIDEFVQTAKERPDQIKEPGDYVAR